VKTATSRQVTDDAEEVGKRDAEHGKCDPDGAWHNWRSVNNLWNSDSPETSAQASAEMPIAYKLFVTTYLTAQGWRR